MLSASFDVAGEASLRPSFVAASHVGTNVPDLFARVRIETRVMFIYLWLVVAADEFEDLRGVDLFATLQVTPDATNDELRRAYKEQALIWHPDRNPDPRSTERYEPNPKP